MESPDATATYCRPSTAKLMGDAVILPPVWYRHNGLPVFASSAMRFPSRDDANRTPPAVAITPLLSDPRKSLKSHIVLPVSGSSALMPAEGGGSLGCGAGGAPRPRPIYCRPASNGVGALTYCCPL